MNVVLLIGALRAEPVGRELPDGTTVWSFDLDAAGSVPVTWTGTPPGWLPGSTLVVAGVVRRRFFRTGGATQSRTEVVASSVTAIGRRRTEERALAAAVASLGPDDVARLRSPVSARSGPTD
jgi:single-strand DNA-binding protein